MAFSQVLHLFGFASKDVPSTVNAETGHFAQRRAWLIIWCSMAMTVVVLVSSPLSTQILNLGLPIWHSVLGFLSSLPCLYFLLNALIIILAITSGFLVLPTTPRTKEPDVQAMNSGKDLNESHAMEAEVNMPMRRAFEDFYSSAMASTAEYNHHEEMQCVRGGSADEGKQEGYMDSDEGACGHQYSSWEQPYNACRQHDCAYGQQSCDGGELLLLQCRATTRTMSYSGEDVMSMAIRGHVCGDVGGRADEGQAWEADRGEEAREEARGRSEDGEVEGDEDGEAACDSGDDGEAGEHIDSASDDGASVHSSRSSSSRKKGYDNGGAIDYSMQPPSCTKNAIAMFVEAAAIRELANEAHRPTIACGVSHTDRTQPAQYHKQANDVLLHPAPHHEEANDLLLHPGVPSLCSASPISPANSQLLEEACILEDSSVDVNGVDGEEAEEEEEEGMISTQELNARADAFILAFRRKLLLTATDEDT